MSEAYKGYLIRTNPLTGTMWIEKDSYFIGYVFDKGAAKQLIDLVLGGLSHVFPSQ